MLPIFIVTPSGRTGTTLLMSLLEQHPSIVAEPSYPYEFRFLQACSPNGYLSPADLFQYPFQDDRDEKLEQVSECVASAAPKDYYLWLADRQGKQAKYCVEKIVGVSIVALKAAYPGARFIISMRDPRDTLMSARRFDAIRGVHGFIERPGDTDMDVVRRTGIHLDALVDLEKLDDCHVVRYEGLIQTPNQELLALTSWLGIEPISDLVAPDHLYHRTSNSGDASIGRWREEMPETLVYLCDAEWGAALQVFNYENGRPLV